MRFSELALRSARRLAVSCLALGLGTGAALAESAAVSALREANREARSGDWEGAFAAADRGGPVVEAIIDWQALRDSGGEFREYTDFIAAHPDWPDLDDLRANAETSIPGKAAPEDILAFFGDELPGTGMGAKALAQALIETGHPDRARRMLEKVWLSQPLNDAGQATLIAAFPDWLGPLNADRASAMLWRWRTADAERMLPLLSTDQQALVRARIATIRERGNAADLTRALPASLRGDPGLAYDRYNHLAEEGDYSAALNILRAHTRSAESLGEPYRWAAWRAQIARWLMREGRAEEAYRVATRHQLSEHSEFYADLEWLSGYLALRYLDRPETALLHFRRSEASTTGPISGSRAAYWQGRALDVLSRPDEAAEAYARGARNQTAFYGLLAAERLGQSLDPRLTGQEDFGDWRTSGELAHNDLTQAMLLLLAADDRDDARRFTLQLARTLDRDGVGQLGNLLEEMHEPYLAVVAGKAAVERGIVVPTAYFPIHPMAREGWPVETELALSIARRESEFNAGVSSPVGAQGLMQLMPATAREVAGQIGLPYSQARLTNWEYNAKLGTRYLATLEEMFGTSPVLIAAGYNAGPGRPRQWMAQRGDIRDADVDVVDWIEHIPFAETRTYVMRVSESIPIYRARLTGQTGPIEFTRLLKGEPPHIRPQARPYLVAAEDLQPVERMSTSSAPAAIAKEAAIDVEAEAAALTQGEPPMRPEARPDQG
ncbi:Soluble lytic murein transglycosylase precursor [Rubellimicrobium mesophilum DSM 19309]|uniref:Soluble lytic murein transglycosylase n=1 Tax=Rubellimicrobium mesophilum DSM 19309 TaxID=442562 RepID=A0A017HVG9_9RHOB|nr:lytic transglycosylase domain-containing protein [Rubellimicrobium mesophilum]EYD78381.1 Soluble lytic murein transglycosylase precursor [Rubellimicrobium mesophilum DSM 19309]